MVNQRFARCLILRMNDRSLFKKHPLSSHGKIRTGSEQDGGMGRSKSGHQNQNGDKVAASSPPKGFDGLYCCNTIGRTFDLDQLIDWQQDQISKIGQKIYNDHCKYAPKQDYWQIAIGVLNFPPDVSNGVPAFISPKCSKHGRKHGGYQPTPAQTDIPRGGLAQSTPIRLSAAQPKDDYGRNTHQYQNDQQLADFSAQFYSPNVYKGK